MYKLTEAQNTVVKNIAVQLLCWTNTFLPKHSGDASAQEDVINDIAALTDVYHNACANNITITDIETLDERYENYGENSVYTLAFLECLSSLLQD